MSERISKTPGRELSVSLEVVSATEWILLRERVGYNYPGYQRRKWETNHVYLSADELAKIATAVERLREEAK